MQAGLMRGSAPSSRPCPRPHQRLSLSPVMAFFFSGGHVGGNRICAEASHGERGPRSFDENSRTAVKVEKIKSAAPSALVSADPSWESLRDHNTSHKTAGAWPAVWKGPASLEWASTELEKGQSEGERGRGRKVSRIHRLNEGLSGQTYRIGAAMVEWELVCGDSRRGGVRGWRGALLVIIWSLSTTPVSHSPTSEGSGPCCVYHGPPMDSLKSDRNKRQDCVLPLPRIYLRLTLLTPALHASQRSKLYSWFGLCIFIIKSGIKMLLTNLEKKKKRKLFICFFLLCIKRFSKLAKPEVGYLPCCFTALFTAFFWRASIWVFKTI